MKKPIFFVLVILAIFAGLFALSHSVKAQSCGNEEECKKLISEYEQKLVGIRDQKNTLSSQIQFADTQVYLTTLRIQDTERKIVQTASEIESLKGRIVTLNSSLDYISKLLLEKIIESYKRREAPLLSIFIDPDSASTMINRLKYAKVTEENDRKLAFQVQQAKLNFEQQKNLREDKQKELAQLEIDLGNQKSALDAQKVQKERLLALTKNDERVYQNLLARTRSEYAAIQGIISGAGTESLIREVHKGDAIATMIYGESCNSSGTHLHFIIKEGSSAINPFNRLKDTNHTDRSGGDTWNPSGDWDWPLSGTIQFNQGWGSDTNFIKSRSASYPFHDGIDIYASSNVIAVLDGELYRGSFSGSDGCALMYVKVKHKDANYSTLYLHVYAL